MILISERYNIYITQNELTTNKKETTRHDYIH